MRILRTKKCITFLQVLLLHKKCVTFVFKKIWYFLLKKCNFQKKKYKCKVTRFSGKVTHFYIKSNTFLWFSRFSYKDSFHLNFDQYIYFLSSKLFVLEILHWDFVWFVAMQKLLILNFYNFLSYIIRYFKGWINIFEYIKSQT